MNTEERGAIKGKIENLLPLVDTFDKDWIANWDDTKQEKYYLAILRTAKKCFITADRDHQRIGAIYMSKECALMLKPKLDKILEKDL